MSFIVYLTFTLVAWGEYFYLYKENFKDRIGSRGWKEKGNLFFIVERKK